MRWLVEVTSFGKTEHESFCVAAETWERALKTARAQRGDHGALAGFSIELVDDGYRAVDPVARLRYVVKPAPDGMVATLTSTDSLPAPAPSSSQSSVLETSQYVALSSAKADLTANDSGPISSVPDTAPLASPKSAPPRPKISVAPRGIPEAPYSEPIVGDPLPGHVPTKLISKREQDPTPESPLAYREFAFLVPEGTSDAEAEAVLRAQLKIVQGALQSTRARKLVNLATFDVKFEGKPPRPPIATLAWKDWKGDPEVVFPKNRMSRPPTPPSAPAQATPAWQPAPTNVAAAPDAPKETLLAAPRFDGPPRPSSIPPPDATLPSLPPLSDSSPASSNPAPVVVAAPAAPVGAALTPIAPPEAVPPAGESDALPLVQQKSAPPPAVQPAQAAVASADPALAATAPAYAPPASPKETLTKPLAVESLNFTPPPSNAYGAPASSRSRLPQKTPSSSSLSARVLAAHGRLTGDELVGALFEAMHDLHFLKDALEGADFCLGLANEMIPSHGGFVYFYDLNRREYVVACTLDQASRKLLSSRFSNADAIAVRAMKKKRALVVSAVEGSAIDGADAPRYATTGTLKSSIFAPILQGNLRLGAIELINPLDEQPFTDDDANGMSYIADQFSEFLGSRGTVLDPERIVTHRSLE